jgi:hypothetical protein
VRFVARGWRGILDDYPSAFSRSHAAGKGVPFQRQDTFRLRFCSGLAARGRQADQVYLVYVFFLCLQGSVPSSGALIYRGSRTVCCIAHIASNPPPRDLKVSDPAVRDLTLAELGLSPSSILHLRFIDDSLNRSFVPLTCTFTSFRAVRTDLQETDCFFFTRFGFTCATFIFDLGTRHRSPCASRL